MEQVGNHQREIEAFFRGRVRYGGSEPVFSQPLVLLGFTNRSGSNLLGEYLRLTGNFSGFHEHLNASAVRNMAERTEARTFPDHMAALAKMQDKKANAYGVKASWDQMLMLLRWRVDRMFASVHVIHIERLDVLAQAVSFSIAAQTRKWMSTQAGTGAKPAYNATDIRNRLDGIGSGNKLIRQICSVYGLDTLTTRYEDLVTEPVAELDRIHKWLGIPLRRLDLGKARLDRQSDGTNATFIARFRAEVLASLQEPSVPGHKVAVVA